MLSRGAHTLSRTGWPAELRHPPPLQHVGRGRPHRDVGEQPGLFPTGLWLSGLTHTGSLPGSQKYSTTFFPVSASKEMVCPVEAGRVNPVAFSPTVSGIMNLLLSAASSVAGSHRTKTVLILTNSLMP